MSFDFIKEVTSVPQWVTTLESYVKNATNQARAEGYEEGFTIGRALTDETERIINFALKLQSSNDLRYLTPLLEVVKCYNEALDEIIDPTDTE